MSGGISVEGRVFGALFNTSVGRTVGVRGIVALADTSLRFRISVGSIWADPNTSAGCVFSESVFGKRTGSHTFQSRVVGKVSIWANLDTQPCSIVCKSQRLLLALVYTSTGVIFSVSSIGAFGNTMPRNVIGECIRGTERNTFFHGQVGKVTWILWTNLNTSHSCIVSKVVVGAGSLATFGEGISINFLLLGTHLHAQFGCWVTVVFWRTSRQKARVVNAFLS